MLKGVIAQWGHFGTLKTDHSPMLIDRVRKIESLWVAGPCGHLPACKLKIEHRCLSSPTSDSSCLSSSSLNSLSLSMQVRESMQSIGYRLGYSRFWVNIWIFFENSSGDKQGLVEFENIWIFFENSSADKQGLVEFENIWIFFENFQAEINRA